MVTMTNRADVLIVTYNSASVIGPCLDALASEGTAGVGVIVVDNDSSDDTVALAQSHAIEATVISSGGNLGYSAAINIGVATSTAEAIFVLNPDTTVTSGAIEVLLAALEDDGVGIAAPLIRNSEGNLEYSIRRFPSASRLLGQTLIGARRAAKYPNWGDTLCDPGSYSQRGRHDWCSGAANMISRTCWDQVGQWNEAFFLYSEETDFAWRAHKLGFDTMFVPDAEVQHHGGDSRVSSRLWSMLVTNRLTVVQLHRGRLHAAMFWTVSVLSELLRSFRPRNRSALVALVTGKVDPAVASARLRSQDSETLHHRQ